MCVWLLKFVCIPCVKEPKEVRRWHGIFETGLKGSCEPSYECWRLNWSVLKERKELLSPLSSPFILFFCMIFFHQEFS